MFRNSLWWRMVFIYIFVPYLPETVLDRQVLSVCTIVFFRLFLMLLFQIITCYTNLSFIVLCFIKSSHFYKKLTILLLPAVIKCLYLQNFKGKMVFFIFMCQLCLIQKHYLFEFLLVRTHSKMPYLIRFNCKYTVLLNVYLTYLWVVLHVSLVFSYKCLIQYLLQNAWTKIPKWIVPITVPLL